MDGHDLLELCVIGAATLSIVSLSSSLLGIELTIILGGTIALGIALSHTPSPKPKRAPSRKTSRRSPSAPSKPHSRAATAPIKERPAIVIPDSPAWYQPLPKKRSRRLAAQPRSLSFDGELW